MSQDEVNPDNPRWRLAGQVCEAIQRRWSDEVVAIGLYGSIAHGADNVGSDVDLLVVTYREDDGPRSVLRRVNGIVVDVTVVSSAEGLRRARELSPRWPLTADRFLTAHVMDDPRGWLAAQRDAHLGRLAEARPAEFAGLAREAWGIAYSAHLRAVHLAERYDSEAALLLLGEARLNAAMVTGLLNRTYFRNAVDAVKQTGMAGASMTELQSVLTNQADELTARGQPVDGQLTSLFD